MTAIAERVTAGAAFLDEHDPEWWRADVERAIDLDRLNMGNGEICVLGQRCPLERLVAHLGFEPEEDDDEDFRYEAQATELSGYHDRESLEMWAGRHGFNYLPADKDVYAGLTAEWKRVITERRSAS